MGFAQDLIDEIENEEFLIRSGRGHEIEPPLPLTIEEQVEARLRTSMVEESWGYLSPNCAQALIDEVDNEGI
jgi:hypothetical protein